MQRRGHMGQAQYGASQSRPTETNKIKSLHDLICFFCFRPNQVDVRTGWLPSAPDPCALHAASVPSTLHPCPDLPKSENP